MFRPLVEAVRHENVPHVRIECALPVAPVDVQCRVSCPCERLWRARANQIILGKVPKSSPVTSRRATLEKSPS
jgi:hypothetical protein